MAVISYTEHFWGGDLKSEKGYDALKNRNRDGKKMCQELEDYLTKRAKLETEFSKSLSNLSKCFKPRNQIGELEVALNSYMTELESMAGSHQRASVFFAGQADAVKTFKEDQLTKMKQLEENLNRTQKSKLSHVKKTAKMRKNYVDKSVERDDAQENFKELERKNGQLKELEKADSKRLKLEDEARKADDNYKTSVLVLEEVTKEWENAMKDTCRAVQQLDEKRLKYLRAELWVCVNVDSKLSLDIDNCCESVRERLEKCDVSQDMIAFLKSASTGKTRPKYIQFRHYTSIDGEESDDESVSSIESNNEDRDKSISGTISKGDRRGGFNKLKIPFKK